MLRITCAHIPTLILVPLQSCSHFMYLYSVSKNPLNLLDLLLLSALRSLQTNSPRPEDTSQSVLHIVQERMSWRGKQAEKREKRNGYVCRKQARCAQKDENPAPRCLTQNALSHDGLITIGTHSKP